MSIRVTCPECSRLIKAGNDLAGRKVKCPRCGHVVGVPGEVGALDGPPTLVEESGAESPPGKSCPSCNQGLEPGAVICVNCGFHLEQGTKLPVAGGSGDDSAGQHADPSLAQSSCFPGRPVKTMSKPFYVLSFVIVWALPSLACVTAVADEIMRRIDLSTLVEILVIASGIGMLYHLVLLVHFLHRIWEAVQDAPARTTPSKAVLFLLVPFFNFYWLFQVIWGWARDCNRLIARKGLSGPQMPESLALAVAILWLASMLVIPAPIFAILFLVFVAQAIDRINLVAGSEKQRGSLAPQAVSPVRQGYDMRQGNKLTSAESVQEPAGVPSGETGGAAQMSDARGKAVGRAGNTQWKIALAIVTVSSVLLIGLLGALLWYRSSRSSALRNALLETRKDKEGSAPVAPVVEGSPSQRQKETDNATSATASRDAKLLGILKMFSHYDRAIGEGRPIPTTEGGGGIVRSEKMVEARRQAVALLRWGGMPEGLLSGAKKMEEAGEEAKFTHVRLLLYGADWPVQSDIHALLGEPDATRTDRYDYPEDDVAIRFRSSDPADDRPPVPGTPTLEWHEYDWLHFGVRNNQVVALAIVCAKAPSRTVDLPTADPLDLPDVRLLALFESFQNFTVHISRPNSSKVGVFILSSDSDFTLHAGVKEDAVLPRAIAEHLLGRSRTASRTSFPERVIEAANLAVEFPELQRIELFQSPAQH